MRIGYLYRFEAFPPVGAQALHAYHLISEFQEAGHEIRGFDPSVPGGMSFPQTSAGVDELLKSIDVLYVRIAGDYLLSWPEAIRAIARAPVPVVWEINAPANENLAFSWLGGSRAPPTTAAGRVIDHARRWFHALRMKPGIRREERLRGRLAHKVAAATAVSGAVGRYAEQQLGIRSVRVVHNGSDHQLNHPGRVPEVLPDNARDRLKVIYAGSPTAPWQGVDVLWEMMARQDSISAEIFWIFLVHERADLVPTAPNVVAYEAVPYEEVGGYLTAADVCLSLQPDFFWSPWGFHGSPMKLFDYMAAGRAIVASTALAEVIQDGRNGLLAEHTADSFLEQLEVLDSDPGLRRRLGTNARRDVERRYNWSAIAERTLDVFESALARSGARSHHV